MAGVSDGILFIPPREEVGRMLAELGNLPEITRASEDLHSAIAQTREEAERATFASRFPNPPSEYFNTMVGGGKRSLTPVVQEAVNREGEAGHKRLSILAEVSSIEQELGVLVGRLLEVRVDLKLAQTEM